MSPAAALLAAVLAALAPAPPAAAQDAPPPPREAERLAGPRWSLSEAIALTARHDPEVRLAMQRVAGQEGGLQSARGIFDDVLFTDVLFTYEQEDLQGRRLQFEIDRRLRFSIPAQALAQVSDQIIQNLPTSGSLLFQRCDPDLQTLVQVELDGGDTVTLCLDSTGELVGILGIDGVADASNVGTLLQILDALPPEIEAAVQDNIEFFADLMRTLAFSLRRASTALRIGRERLGGLPETERFLELDADVGYQLRFRNGMAATAGLSLIGTEDNFAGKPLDPRFGDTVFPNLFTGTLGLNLDVPLGKGRGQVAVAAAERAAEAQLLANYHLLAHVTAQQALETVTAYWSLAAAEDRLRLLRRSLGIQEEILGHTRELVEADQIPAADVSLTAARVANLRASVATARQRLAEGRYDLLRAVGLEGEPVDAAPLATGLGAGELDPLTADALAAEAVARRHDIAAAAAAADAAAHLAAGARANLRHRVDLSLNLSYGGLHESFFERVYDPEPYWNALTEGLAGPSYGILLRWLLPFGNNTARGQLVQADASLARSEIVHADLERQVRSRIRDLHASLGRVEAQQEALEAALGFQEETLEASLTRFRAGDLSLIDTLVTEEELTRTRLQKLESDLQVALLRARLLFESGRLLEEQPEVLEFDPLLVRPAPALTPAPRGET